VNGQPASEPVPAGRRAGLSIRVAAILAAVLLLAFGGATAWAVMTNAELERTRATLAETDADLTATKASLGDVAADLSSTADDLEAEQASISANESRITVLEFQIERKAACIEAQTANLAEFRRILALERENFARTTSGSAWAKAIAASDRALDLAVDYLAKSYSSAAAGSYNTANSWLGKSNAQISVSNKQIGIANNQNEVINAASDAINAATDALYATLDDTLSTCGR
jgi:chromosome segregation ATPase